MAKKNFNDIAANYDKQSGTFGEKQYDDDLFNALNESDISDNRLNIFEIQADITQPRRIVPRSVRGAWDGTPKQAPDILGEWAVRAKISEPMIKKILQSETSAFDNNSGDPVTDEFLKLLDLAAQIHDVGLQQAIGVLTIPDGYQIIFGERRWMAFHALNKWLGDYARIPARVANVTEWELAKIQAAENFQRDELNAISKARQFAKLLMIARADSDTPYDPYHHLVIEGGCDRPYYAQVADGNVHKIPYGMGAQFEAALGISTTQMRQYRNLLKLTGDYDTDNLIWDTGDELNWSENFMREIGRNLLHGTIRSIIESSDTPESDLRAKLVEVEEAKKRNDRYASQEAQAQTAPRPEPQRDPFGRELDSDGRPKHDRQQRESDNWINQIVYVDGQRGTVRSSVSSHDVIIRMDDGSEQVRHISALSTTPPQDDDQPAYMKEEHPSYNPGDEVIINDATPGTVVSSHAGGKYYKVKLADGAIPTVDVSQLRPAVTPSGDDTALHSHNPASDDADDNAHSTDALLLEESTIDAIPVLNIFRSLAYELKHGPAQSVIARLNAQSGHDLDALAELSEEEINEWLESKHRPIEDLLRRAMARYEEYLYWLHEQITRKQA